MKNWLDKIPAPLRKVAPVGFSLLMLCLAFAPANVFLLVFVALAPYLAYLRDCSKKAALWSGYWFGFLYFGFQMVWVQGFVGRFLGNPVMGAIPWVLCAFLAGFFYMLAAWLVKRCYLIDKIWLIPLVWAGVEGLRAYFPILAFPWANVAHPLWVTPWLVQSAAYGTVFLVSAWVVLFNLIVSETVFRPSDVQKHLDVQVLSRFSLAFAAIFFLGAARMSLLPETKSLVVTAGQPGVDMAFTTPEEEAQQLREATGVLVAGALNQESSLLVLPEGYAGSVFDDVPETPLGFEPPLPVMMGGQRFADGTSYQSAIIWDGVKWSHADKTRLVVMGEYVPFRDQLPFLKNFNVAYEDLSPGKELVTPEIGGVKMGPLICFEGVFPDLADRHSRQGAQVLVQMSIDDWYEATGAYAQLWQSTVWRSIESGLPVVRVGARGQSLCTDNRGQIRHFAPVGETVPMQCRLEMPVGGSDAIPYKTGFILLSWGAGVYVILVPVVDGVRKRARKTASEKTV